jgi:putative FmdB family regulatory protein
MRYDYQCSSCDAVHEIDHGIKTTKRKCPKCGKNELEKIFLSAPIAFVRQDAVTVGQQAERNAKRMGKNEVQERDLKDKENKKEPMNQAKKELYKKIGKSDESKREKFINEGVI